MKWEIWNKMSNKQKEEWKYRFERKSRDIKVDIIKDFLYPIVFMMICIILILIISIATDNKILFKLGISLLGIMQFWFWLITLIFVFYLVFGVTIICYGYNKRKKWLKNQKLL